MLLNGWSSPVAMGRFGAFDPHPTLSLNRCGMSPAGCIGTVDFATNFNLIEAIEKGLPESR
jgi:hypothetical protein